MLFVERIIEHAGEAVDVRKHHLRDDVIVCEIREMRTGDLGENRTSGFVDVCLWLSSG